MSTGSLRISTLKFFSTCTFGKVRGTACVDRRIGKIPAMCVRKNAYFARLFNLHNRSDTSYGNERCGLFAVFNVVLIFFIFIFLTFCTLYCVLLPSEIVSNMSLKIVT